LRLWSPFEDTHANLEIKVPANSAGTYKITDGWNEYADKISAL
jgi:hypothetical protein